MEEKESKVLGVKYVVVDGNFLTSTGALLSVKDVHGKSNKEVKKLYDDALAGKKYDYVYAKNTGYVRAKKAVYQAKTVEEKTEVEENTAHIEVKQEAEAKTEKITVVPLGKEPIKITLVAVVSIVLLIIALASIFISVYYTAEFLLIYVPNPGAVVLSSIMVAFATMAFESGILLWRKKEKALAAIMFTLWPCVVAFSMLSTMAVNYDGFKVREQEALADSRVLNSGRQQLTIIEERIAMKDDEIQRKKDTIEAYLLKEKQSEWQKTVYNNELAKLNKEKEAILNEKMTLAKENPDSAIVQETRKESFFTLIEKMFGIKEYFAQFLMSVLPALFVDLVTPLSLATVIVLNEKKKE